LARVLGFETKNNAEETVNTVEGYTTVLATNKKAVDDQIESSKKEIFHRKTLNREQTNNINSINQLIMASRTFGKEMENSAKKVRNALKSLGYDVSSRGASGIAWQKIPSHLFHARMARATPSLGIYARSSHAVTGSLSARYAAYSAKRGGD